MYGENYQHGRARAWHARIIGGPGGPVILRNTIADLAPDEDVIDDPPTRSLTWDQWVQEHVQLGFNLDGTPKET